MMLMLLFVSWIVFIYSFHFCILPFSWFIIISNPFISCTNRLYIYVFLFLFYFIIFILFNIFFLLNSFTFILIFIFILFYIFIMLNKICIYFHSYFLNSVIILLSFYFIIVILWRCYIWIRFNNLSTCFFKVKSWSIFNPNYS